jgi:asparagine synthase (glutamine-hydrolysing)
MNGVGTHAAHAADSTTMCGIAGILGRTDASTNRDALARMSAAMTHRGPDADGTWTSSADAAGMGVLLAHRRLSILDLSPAGAQPMTDPATGATLVFNGELYNYRALRDGLAACGQTFHSSGDTEVLLRALVEGGAGAVPSLRGMYAFAFFDPAARTLLLARDPLGIKPLYLARNPDPRGVWTVAFASEVRALLASGLLGAPRLDPRAVASVVWNGFVVGPHTAVSGVECLTPGTACVLDGAGRELRREATWCARARPEAPLDDAALGEALQESVRLHLASDVPLGVFLSSGIDSSAVANLAQRASSRPVHTFTLAFEERELDEREPARAIACAIGSEHREVVLSEARFVADLDAALDSIDQPTFDGLNSYYMSHAVREAGLKVALVGTGGDELFGGYASFRVLPALAAWSRRGRLVPRAARVALARLVAGLVARGAGPVAPQTRWAKLPDFVERGDDLVASYQLAYALFLPKFQEELLAGDARAALADGLPEETRALLRAEIAGRADRAAVSVLEERMFLGERLLRDSDAASMAVSLELRLPLVDQILFEHVDRLPDAVRYLPAGKKAALRRAALGGLDPALFDRPKRGFVLPFDRWIRRTLGDVMDRTLRDPAQVAPVGLDPAAVARLWEAYLAGAPGLYWSRVWALYVLVRWCHRHGVVL